MQFILSATVMVVLKASSVTQGTVEVKPRPPKTRRALGTR